jgi:arylsulfatase B
MFLMVSHLAGHAGRGGIEPGVPDADSTNTKYRYISNPRRRLYATLRYCSNPHDSEIVNLLDKSVGTIVKRLAQRNMLESSIVLFFSDNGAPTLGPYANTGSNWPLRGVPQPNQKFRTTDVVLSDQADEF